MLLFALSFIAGVSLGLFLLPQDIWQWFLVGSSVVLLGSLGHLPRLFLIFGFCFFIFALGFMRAMEAKAQFGSEKYILASSEIISDVIKPLKTKFIKVAQENLSPPGDEIVLAMILGENQALSFDLKEKLNFSGLRHVIAISGMHITLLSVIFVELFLRLGMWRHHALFLSILVIIFYIILVGFPASGIRAAIMGSLLAFAQAFGRLSESSRAVIIAGALMIAFNPMLLISDIGFQLSFLATLGLVHLTPIFLHLFKALPEKISFLKSIIAMTLSAQIFTFPVLIYHFGYFSLSAILSNILVLPILPLIMILSLGFLVGGVIFEFLGWLISLPLGLLLSYLSFIIETFSSFATFNLWMSLSFNGLLISYLVIGFLTWYFKRRFYFETLPF